MEAPTRIVIAGAGHAGGAVAATLRQYGWRGPITLIGEEPLPPYQRPPLSKAWLKGEADADSLLLRPDIVLRHQRHRPPSHRTGDPDRPPGPHRVARLRRNHPLRPSHPGARLDPPGARRSRCRPAWRAGPAQRRRRRPAAGRAASRRAAGGDRRRLYRPGGRRLRPRPGRRGGGDRARIPRAGPRRRPGAVGLLPAPARRAWRSGWNSARRWKRWKARMVPSPACACATVG